MKVDPVKPTDVAEGDGYDAHVSPVAIRIRQARERRGLSMDALARELGVAKNTVFRWEKKGVMPGGDLLDALAATLEVPVEWIMRGDEPAPPSLAHPKPAHWDEFIANYPRIDELSEEDLEGIKDFAARRGSRVRDWFGWAEIAEWVRKAKPHPELDGEP